MGIFSKKHKGDRPVDTGPGREVGQPIDRTVPSDAELERQLRDMREANQRVEGNAALQAVFAQLVGSPQPQPQPPSLEDLRERVARGGLSYIMSAPVDCSDVAPEAAKLHMQGAIGALTGDDASSLALFTKALHLVRDVGHKTAEARLLYNVGVAHYKLGDLTCSLDVLLEGKTLAEEASRDLAREARKLQRFRDERTLDDPRVEVFGVPDMEQQLLVMFTEALATVHDAAGHASEAADYRREVERLRCERR